MLKRSLGHRWWRLAFAKKHKSPHTCVQQEEISSPGCHSSISFPFWHAFQKRPPLSWTVEESREKHLGVKASFYYYPIPIANTLSWPSVLTTWLAFKRSSKKLLSSGISGNHAGPASILQFALLDSKSLMVFRFTSSIPSQDMILHIWHLGQRKSIRRQETTLQFPDFFLCFCHKIVSGTDFGTFTCSLTWYWSGCVKERKN